MLPKELQVVRYIRLLLLLVTVCAFPAFPDERATADDQLMHAMLSPVVCTRQGIGTFFQSTYNSPHYKDFLSACFMHVVDLVEHAHASCSNPLFLRQIFLIFSQKLKEVQWVNPYALMYFLDRVQPLLLDIYSCEKSMLDAHAEEYLAKVLMHEFPLLQSDPSAFVKKHAQVLVKDISTMASDQLATKIAFAAFVEQSIDRVVFDYSEGYEAWTCFLRLLACIVSAHHASLLCDDATFNRILWALCARFVYCTELHGSEIDRVVGQKIIEECISTTTLLLDSDEIDPLLLSKQDWLHEHLVRAMK